MGRKRADMVEGQPDQLTERLRGSRLRFAAFSRTDIALWLMMHQMRYTRQASALIDAGRHGADTAGGVAAAQDSAHTCCRLIEQLSQSWALRDWHEVQSLMTDDGTQPYPADDSPDQEGV